jgi:hypothetical protein
LLFPAARTPHDSRLHTPPHRDGDGQLIAAQLVTTRTIGNGSRQAVNLQITDV